MRPGQAVPFSGGAAGRYPPAASTAAPTSAAPCPRPVTANLANFMRTLALPKEVEHWSLTTIREKLVKNGAEVIAQGRYVTFQTRSNERRGGKECVGTCRSRWSPSH